jgi:hypothetical protein
LAGITYVNQVGAIGGMNQAAPGTLIPDTFVRFAQDVLFDRAGFIRRRGPFKAFKMYNADNTADTTAFVESGATDEYVLGVFSTFDPNGVPRIGMMINSYTLSTNSTKTIFRVFDKQLKFLGEELIFPDSTVTTTQSDFIENLSIVSGKQALGGGVWITFAGTPSDSTQHYQFFWRGGYNGAAPAAGPIIKTGCSFGTPIQGDFGTGHGTLGSTVTLNTTGLASGMFVYANYNDGTGLKDYYVGTIKTTTPTTITLDKYPFMWNTFFNSNATDGSTGHLGDTTYTASYTNATLKFTSVRPYEFMHGRGAITIDSATTTSLKSGAAGTSGEGHWSSASVAGWYLYRASDNAFLGKISSVTDNTTATLVYHTGLILTGENYVMKLITPTVLNSATPIGSTGFSSIIANRTANNFAGLYTAVYAGYQWYGNVANADKDVNRVVFSASHDKEAVDLSANAADSIVFPGKSQFRGMAAAATGLLVFLEDRTYILRGNDRTNFSVEQLYPEGCLCASSIVEYGGGVFWAGKSGILYYDGASVRNMTKDNLGLYYTDALDVFNPELDRVIAFIHKNNLVMTFTSFNSPFKAIRYEPLYAADWQSLVVQGRSWAELDPNFTYADKDPSLQNNTPLYWDQQILNDPAASGDTGLSFKWNDGGSSLWKTTSNIYKWSPLRKQTSMTFNIYLPTNALTTFSNMDFRGAANIETTNGLKTLVGVNSVETNNLRARLIDIHPVYDINTDGKDAYTIEKINIPKTSLILGPDFYLQTKHYTMGNPMLRKWFQRVMLSMLLYDGCLRMDIVDADDNDAIDIVKKKHQYWELFTEEGYTWDYLGKGEGYDFGVVFPKLTSPNKSTWDNVEKTLTLWDELFMADFNRYKMRTAWRNPSLGFRLYQLNNYKKPYNSSVTTPNRVEIQSFTVGFKALREGRQ